MTYEQAKALAQERANATGCDHGVERDAFGYRAFMLPGLRFRYGHELHCEVVSCTDLDKCQRGHGPMASQVRS